MIEPITTGRIVLHLGVADFPYVEDTTSGAEPVRKGKKRGGSRWRRSDLIGGDVSTTGDVAQILEDKYAVMSTFVLLHEPEIADALANGLAGTLESIIQGAPPPENPYAGGEEAITQMFRTFLDSREIESTGIPGVPTEAALRGVSHRFKHPFAKRASRPSFIDTGTYQTSMRAWITT